MFRMALLRLGFKTRLVIAGLLLAAALGLYLWGNREHNVIDLRANWEITLPGTAGLDKIYETNTGLSLRGEGIGYYVYTYENEAVVEDLFDWEASQQRTLFHTSRVEAAEDWMDQTFAKEEYRPNWEACESWYTAKADNSELIAFLDPTVKQIYFIESLL